MQVARTSEAMKLAEDEMIEEIEELGLIRTIEYIRHENMPIKMYQGASITAVTTVKLFMVPEDMSRRECIESCVPVSIGEAFCSDKDQFSRLKGRLTATARALKRFRGKLNENECICT